MIFSALLFLEDCFRILTCAFPTMQKMKLSINDFFNESNQIRSFLRIWSHLRKKSLMENFMFYAFLLPILQEI